ncbi:MAG: CoA-binding protein [Candidatus Bathyarchaeia archaeon]|jgi:succinyl-CoA synthetase alpha subunit
MAILIDENTTAIIQGITGRAGESYSRYMKAYGTKILAGVTPGRGGSTAAGVPVYDTVDEAVAKHGSIDASVTFVPAPYLKDAVLEAIDAGIKMVVSPVERVPLHDLIVMAAAAKKNGVMLVGPGTIGIMSPGKAVLGWVGSSVTRAAQVFKPGPVGILSRSGGQSGTLPWIIKEHTGYGCSTLFHEGTEPIIGTSFGDVMSLYEADEQTKVVAMFGELGGTTEEEVAEEMQKGHYTKPLVAYIAGAWAPEGMRFSHASSIIEHGTGSAKSKIEALTNAGAYVVEKPFDIVTKIKEILD